MMESVLQMYQNLFLMLATEILASQAHSVFAIDIQVVCEERTSL